MSCCGGRGGSGAKCTCKVVAGDGITVTGNGSSGNPYKIEGKGGQGGGLADCDAARACFSAEGPATFDPKTGKIGVDLSKDAGNIIRKGTDGGLLVPPPSNAGDLTIPDWPHACAVDESGAAVYKGEDGGLYTDTVLDTYSRTWAGNLKSTAANASVPEGMGLDNVRELYVARPKIENPDKCRSARILYTIQTSVWFTLPPGASARAYNGEKNLDENYSVTNGSQTEIKEEQVEVNRMFFHYDLKPGETKEFPFFMWVGGGTKGAKWTELDWNIRTLTIVGTRKNTHARMTEI